MKGPLTQPEVTRGKGSLIPLKRRSRGKKQRILDLVITILFSPMWLLCMALILVLKGVIDGKPVLFVQERVGLAGKPFRMYKIRTTPEWYVPKPEDWSDAHFPPRT